MSNLVRVILSFKNPKKLEFLHLSNLLFTAESLTDQQIYIATPPTEFKLANGACVIYSAARLSCQV
jgi:hypothetical protein